MHAQPPLSRRRTVGATLAAVVENQYAAGIMNTDTTIALRGHHLGCMLTAFSKDSGHPTLPLAVAHVRAHPDGDVHVVVGPDDICVPCPDWDGSTCRRGHEEKNVVKDRAFLELLGMADGEALPAREVFARLASRADADFFRRVCPSCHPDACAEAAAAADFSGGF